MQPYRAPQPFARSALPVILLGTFLLGWVGCSSDSDPGTGQDTAWIPTLPHENIGDEPYETIIEEFEVVALSGATLYGLLRRPDPDQYPDLSFAAVIKVAGGINPGRLEARGSEARTLAEAGMVVVCFNAEGRADASPEDSLSEGTEDYNGYRNQDGLGAIIEFVHALPYVIGDNIGLRTSSYGITMAAGCLGRYPALPVKYLVDDEGPPNSFVTVHEPYALDADSTNDKHVLVHDILGGHYSTTRDSSQINRSFWEEREADRFIGGFRGRYVRLQGVYDHAQPPADASEAATFDLPPLWWQGRHTAIMANAAVAGGVPWVRVNLPEQGNAVGATYEYGEMPVLIPGTVAEGPFWAARAVIEMARME